MNILKQIGMIIILLLVGILVYQANIPIEKDKMETLVYLSQPYHVDRVYKSMQGPNATEEIFIGDKTKKELVWIKGMRAQMMNTQDLTNASQDFMCHTNIDFHRDQRFNLHKSFTMGSGRIITLSQGQLAMKFPEGYGVPVYSNEPISIETQVLNLNIPNINTYVNHKVIIDYIKDKNLTKPMKALFTSGAQSMVLVEGNTPYYNISSANPEEHGPGCSIGETAGDVKYHDKTTGSKFTGHWVIPPGRHEYSSSVTYFMNVPYDTTMHYAEVHVHPFAEYLELRDRTTGETVFKSYAKDFEDRLGLEFVDYFSSTKGKPIYKDHEYELVSVYNNTSGVDQDAMGHMVLFLHDKQFRK